MTLAFVGMQILLRVNYIERKNGEQSRLCRGAEGVRFNSYYIRRLFGLRSGCPSHESVLLLNNIRDKYVNRQFVSRSCRWRGMEFSTKLRKTKAQFLSF